MNITDTAASQYNPIARPLPWEKTVRLNPEVDAKESASRWDTTDTLELSDAYIKKTQGPPTYGGEASARYKAERLASIDYDEKDVAHIKERFSSVLERKQDITAKLKKILESTGSELGMGDKIKIEVDRNGKAVVGGISDAKLARKLEKAVNNDKELIKDIKTLQEDEATVSRELKAVTGSGLNDFKARIGELQKSNFMAELSGDIEEGWVYSKEQRIDLKDQDLYMVDEELATMISEYCKDGSANSIAGHTVDVSGGNDILLNAEGTVNGVVKDVMKKVTSYLEDVNKKIRELYENDQEELEKHLVSLSGVTIGLDSEGTVTIDGSFSEAGDWDNMIKDTITNGFFKEELKANPYSGEKHDFFIAAQYLENQYDLAFDGMDKDRKLETVYHRGLVQSQLSSPEEEEKLTEEIVVEARAALEEMGVKGVDSLDIQINDKGKLTVANMPQDKAQQSILAASLDSLNKMIANRTNEDYNELKEFTTDHKEKLRGLMAKMDVFLPGGAGLLKKMKPSAALDEE